MAATTDAHYQAKEVYHANVEVIGQHLTKATHILVAVARHDAEDDWGASRHGYLWVKARRKTKAEQVRQAYINSCSSDQQHANLSLTLHGGNVSPETSIGECEVYQDQFVLLQAFVPNPAPALSVVREDTPASKKATTTPETTVMKYQPCSSGTPVRQPLQPTNRQLTVPPQQSLDEAKDIKRGSSPHGSNDGPTVPSFFEFQDEPCDRKSATPVVAQPQLIASESATPSIAPAPLPEFHGGASKPTPDISRQPSLKRERSEENDSKHLDNSFEKIADDFDRLARGQKLRRLAEESQPERLEASLESPLKQLPANADANALLQQIENVRKEAVKSKTVVGVVGSTGAGKSSVINAMLDEERLVPTTCMRACTAVVTELSYNHSNSEHAKSRAEIEFITPDEWRKELTVLFDEVFDDSGRLLHDARDPDSQSGIAYAKIRAGYNTFTQDMLGKASVEKLMQVPKVRSTLGTTKRVNERQPETFYKRLQTYVDSREKGEEKLDKNGKRIGLRKREFEFWPLIKVVRIYVKADALKTGAVVVDFPGVHDSNAARAAVAEGYMKQCTGLWIVAPINRAVDDKAAQKLLGDTFKRQLKFDGTYSAVTFICSKTDDISRTEATDSLQLGKEMEEIESQLRALMRQRKDLSAQLKAAKEKKQDYDSVFEDVDEKVDVWDKLQDDLDSGKTVYAPLEKSKKLKRTARISTSSRKKRRSSEDSSDEEIEISSDDEATSTSDDPSRGPPLTMQQVEEKLDKLRTLKKDARREKSSIDERIRDLRKQISKIQEQEGELEDQADAWCIAGRNNYSRAAIKQDFATGVRDLDMENAEEENPDTFNLEEDLRDYDEVARSLPVFCVSSRAYQKIQGRLQKDNDVPGFTTAEQTEMPQLQARCRKLTENGRAANCRRFLNSFNRLLLSLAVWASDDGSGPQLNPQQQDFEARYLGRRLGDLEEALKKAVNTTVSEIQKTMAGYVFDLFGPAADAAAKATNKTQASWGAHRNDGGMLWATYKATTRRSGVFQGSRGLRDFNTELIEPMMRQLQNQWEKTFQRKLPQIVNEFSRNGNKLLKEFHATIETRCQEKGHGLARIGMLGDGLRNYEHVFNDASSATITYINERQRDVNREFVPVVTRIMQTAYDRCNGESGTDSYMRMKGHMEAFVDQNKSNMFTQSCREVKQRLSDLCEEVRKAMLERVDGVHANMRRDYMSLVGGVDLGHQQLPYEQRTIRRQLDDVISRVDEEFEKVLQKSLEELQASVVGDEDGDAEMMCEDAGDADEGEVEDEDDEEDSPKDEGAASDIEQAEEPMGVKDED